mmetsp:Transcript_10804/g.20979  ORF Transcript_10804/g.20979 Transcript_10804/m.20979 type:complete len:275 (-) Transcript_10804:478-1302(-)
MRLGLCSRHLPLLLLLPLLLCVTMHAKIQEETHATVHQAPYWDSGPLLEIETLACAPPFQPNRHFVWPPKPSSLNGKLANDRASSLGSSALLLLLALRHSEKCHLKIPHVELNLWPLFAEQTCLPLPTLRWGFVSQLNGTCLQGSCPLHKSALANPQCCSDSYPLCGKLGSHHENQDHQRCRSDPGQQWQVPDGHWPLQKAPLSVLLLRSHACVQFAGTRGWCPGLVVTPAPSPLERPHQVLRAPLLDRCCVGGAVVLGTHRRWHLRDPDLLIQ